MYHTPEKVIEAATIQAAITHNTPDGINAAVAAALMSHYFIYRLGPKRKLGKFLEAYVSGQWSKAWQGEVKSKGWMSVRAAITAVMRNDSMSQLLQHCIAFSGDVDTVAAMSTTGYAYTLAAGSCSEEITKTSPTISSQV
nr:ADP-ribosylglycohydrolase family protein [Nostoc paludosum]